MTLLDVKQAAVELRCTPCNIRRKVRAREITFRRLGGRIFFTLGDIESYINQCTVPAGNFSDRKVQK